MGYSSFLLVKDSGTVMPVSSLCSQSLLCSGPNSSGDLSHFAGLVLDLVGMVSSPGGQSVLCVGASPKSIIQGGRQQQAEVEPAALELSCSIFRESSSFSCFHYKLWSSGK